MNLPIVREEILISIGAYIENITNDHTLRITKRVLLNYFDGKKGNIENFAKAEHLIRYRDKLIKEGKSTKTITTYIGILNSFFNFLLARGDIRVNEYKLVKLPHVVSKPTLKLTPSELVKLKNWVPEGLNERAYNIALMIFILSGARGNAVLSLKWEDIKTDDSRGLYFEFKEKMGRVRRYYIIKKLEDKIIQFRRDWEKEKGEYLFDEDYIIQINRGKIGSKMKNPLATKNFNKAIRRLTGVEGFSTHRPRAGVVTGLLDSGESPRDVANFMDMTLTTVEKYDNGNKDKDLEIAKKLDKLL